MGIFGVFTELAASVPRTEIVGKSDYFRFGMRDSLAIEASFLQVNFFPPSYLIYIDFAHVMLWLLVLPRSIFR